MRVTFPRPPGLDVIRRPGDEQGRVSARSRPGSRTLDDDFNKPWNKVKRFIGHNAVALALALLALGIAVMSLLRFMTPRAQGLDAQVPARAARRPPPALAYGLAHEGADTNNTVLATMLDLTERGFYDTKTSSAKKEKLDLSVSKSSKRPSAEKLTDYEQKVLGFFDELIGDDTVVLSEMKDKIPKHSDEWRTKWEDMTSSLNAADEGQLSWDRSYGKYQGLLLLGIAVSAP